MPMIRVAIADDHQIVRTGFKQFISDQIDMKVLHEASNGNEAMDIVRKKECDVLLLDISMPGQNGVDTLRQIKLTHPELPVLILSGFAEEQYAMNMLRMGASGYLKKDCDPNELIKAIRIAAQGRRYISQSVGEVLASGVNKDNEAPVHTQLSDRELQVFIRLSKGETVTDIANQLHISVKTVSTYRTRVLEKMGLTSNSDLTYYAMKNGLME